MTDPLDTDHEAALREFCALPSEPRAALDEFYRERLYPLAQARVRRKACPEVDTLFLTAGAQAWSVAHSLVATPARHVVFLCTEVSQRSAAMAITLAQLSPEVDVRFPRVREADPATVYSEILRAYRDLGEPRDVVVDFTSGTKAMSAAASSAAMFIRARQRYVASVPVRLGFHGREAVHFLDHPLSHMGDLQRREAEQFFDQLSFDRAADLFQRLDDQGAPDFLYRERASLARAYAAWDALRFEEAAKLIASMLQRVRNHSGPDPLAKHANRLDTQRVQLESLAKAPPTAVFLRFLVSYAARREAQGLLDAATLVHYRSIEETIQARLREAHRIEHSAATPDAYARAATDAGVEDLLAAYNRAVNRPEFQMVALPEKISLAQGWTLLRVLRDPLVDGVDTHRLLGRVELRNKSVFAHGRATLSRSDFDAFVKIASEVRASYASVAGVELPRPDPEFDFIALSSHPTAG